MSQEVTAETIRALAQNPPTDWKLRKELYNAAQELMWAVELPPDTDQRIMLGGLQLSTTLTASNMQVFDTLMSAPSEAMNVDKLAQPVHADPALVHRICRYLRAIGLLDEVGDGIYQANHITAQVAKPGFKAGMLHFYHRSDPGFVALPEFLRMTDYRNPTDSNNTARSMAFKNQDEVFAYYRKNPEMAAATAKYMAHYKASAPAWFDGAVPLDDFKMSTQDLEERRALLVDVGGGLGHVCFEFRKALPDFKGHMVVQDIPAMIEQIDEEHAKAQDIEPMAHDFTTPQPVKGAKVYYLRSVLHDWTFEKNQVILRQLRDAMAPDSVIVMDEMVVPDTGASFKQTTFDLAMMASLAAQERTREEWEELTASVGLKIRNVWVYDEDMQSALIVAVKA